MPDFVRSVEIDAPIEVVFGFHEREDALTLLAPSFPPVRLVSKTAGIDVGTRVELRILFFRWVALHTDYKPNRLFVDKQTEGPFAEWVHRHEFEPLGERTRLTDRVRYRLPGGAFVNALLGWAVNIGLAGMFRHRHAVTRRCSEHPAPQARNHAG